MKMLCAIVSIVLLAACARQTVQPTGLYRLATPERAMVLDVRASGDYVLQVDGPDSMTDEIRGRWNDERGQDIDVTFHGVVWHGSEPEAGNGLWMVSFERDGGICIDGEGATCFAKDEA
jgi:hypothetical protein